MYTYVINGFIVPVTNKEHAELNDLLARALELRRAIAQGLGAGCPKDGFGMVQMIETADELENAYNGYIFKLYESAFKRGTSKRTDRTYQVNEIGYGKYERVNG